MSTHTSGRRNALVLGVIVTCQLMVVLDAAVMNIALPQIQHGLHFSTAGLSWVIDAYTLTFGGLLLLGGRAGDVLGRKRTFLGGIALFTLASLVGGLAPNAAFLVIARAVQGVGAAAAAPSALALITANFKEGTARDKALSVFAAASSGGASLGLILGGALTGLSWRWVLIINVPIGIAVLAIAPRLLEDTDRNRGKLDYAGAVTSVLGMGSLVYSFIRAASEGWSDPVAIGGIAVGVVAMTTFVLVERRAETPVVPLRLLKSRTRAGGYLTMLLLPSGMFGMFFYATQFLQEAKGLSALTTGLAFLPMTVLLFVVSRSAPRLLARFGARPLLVVGMTSAAAGLGWLSQLHVSSSYLGSILGPMLLLGFGAGLAFMPIFSTVLAGVERRDSGAASSMLQAMQQVGGSLGLAVLVTLFGAATHHASVAGDVGLFTTGVRAAFLGAAVFAAVGLVVVLAVVRPTRPTLGQAEVAEQEAEPILEMA